MEQKNMMKEKRTNLETIRACCADELAFYISKKFDESCPGKKKYTKGACSLSKCQACWLEWLLAQEDEEWDRLWEEGKGVE